MIDFRPAREAIEKAQRILITSHVRPDGDAVGSVAALANMITRIAKQDQRDCEVQVLLLGEVAEQYGFVLSDDLAIWMLGREVTAENVAEKLDGFDLVIVADTRAVNQLPIVGEYLLKRDKGVLVIDHHLTGDEIGDVRLIDSSVGATGEIVYQLSQESGWRIAGTTAQALFMAIATDTGWFRFSNTSGATLRRAGELVGTGVVPEKMYQRLFESFPPERMRLVARVLETMELRCGGRLAVMTITNQMLKETGAKRIHIENIVNESQQVASVVVSLLMVEQEDGATRCSLRSRSDDVDVNKIAKQFGGGGHARAAGVTIEESMDQARAKLVAAIEPLIDTNNY
ncbi:MAG: bifunctional oligoribonuclease/PAP phosphatase NrnA [Sedimentisphaerales bacterium]|nr:bifunctional oligoribonuclease/PAP phosphatase NrnA [Sedimentisphaerales bacterium]